MLAVTLEPKIVAVARELAMGIFTLEQILKSAGVTPEEYESFANSERFLDMVRQMAREWGGPMNTADRIRAKSQAIIEDVLPDMHSRMTSQSESFSAQVDALKTIRLMAGVGGEKGEEREREQFSLTINIGDGKPTVITGGSGSLIEGKVEGAGLTPGVSFGGASINDELAGGLDGY